MTTVSNPLLSICIPTYNRARYIGETLESIAKQIESRVEVVVSDNASEDETEAVVESYRSRLGQLRYHRWPENMGADKNFLKVMDIATGTYCWLMGSDDAITPGAILKILTLLSNEPRDLYLAARLNCTMEMEPYSLETWLESEEAGFYNFLLQSDFLAYHQKAKTLGAVFSYLSTIIVRRSCWSAAEMNDRYIGSAYSHAYLLLQVANLSGVYYIPWPIIYNRVGNDYFAKDGEAPRIMLDLQGYLMMANDIYCDSSVRRLAFLKLLRRAHAPTRTILALRSRLDDRAFRLAKDTLINCGYSPAISALALYIGQKPFIFALRFKHALKFRK